MKLWAGMAMAGVILASSLQAGDWPQWRGPERNGMSAEKVNTSWPAEGPKELWRAAVGIGFSGISVSRGRAYTMGNTNEQDTIWCFDAVTGRELWRHTYAARLDPQYYEGGPTCTPTIEGGRVFTMSKWGSVFCLDAASGAMVWHQDLWENGIKSNRWGFAGSPLIWKDLVILNAGGAGTALNRDTGRMVWFNGTNVAGYASPTLFRDGGQEAVLIFAAKHLVALEPKTGRELWRQRFETSYDTNNSDPIAHRNSVLISSFSRGCALLSVKDGQPEVVYQNKNLHNHLSAGILRGEYLYAFNGEAKFQTDFRCLHVPTGEVKWIRKDPKFGSLICADDKLLILSEKGELLAAEVSPTEFKLLARAPVLDGVCWTPPSLANGLLYARNAKGTLVCLELR